jgi:hypothetical protein
MWVDFILEKGGGGGDDGSWLAGVAGMCKIRFRHLPFLNELIYFPSADDAYMV